MDAGYGMTSKGQGMGIAGFPVRYVLDVPIHAATRAEVVTACDDAVRHGTYLLIGVVNVAKLVHIQGDADLRDAVTDADIVVADGMGVVWASRMLGEPLPERVAGIDLFLDLVALAEESGHSIYLLGAEQAIVDECQRVLLEAHPDLVVAGTRNGYFDDAEAPEVAAMIADSGADLLFVGMSSPHKEIFLARFGESLGVSVCHGVGGSFDVVAGRVKRAPEAWQRWGMEWFYRLIQEPRRMWKRYLTTNTALVWLVLRERLRQLRPIREAGR
jgi:N-acetylglucosaminyldiphosphoundecaprenol N-acetyl-beta-D-mannosaminyltransferase